MLLAEKISLKQTAGVLFLSLVQRRGMTNKIRKSGMVEAIPVVCQKA
jgi:hypothetical protein